MIKLTEKNGSVNLAQKMMKGDDGGYYIPNVDEAGNLTWTPSEEGMAETASSNIMGPTGPIGPSGVYVGVEEPTDPNILVWLIPTGEVSDYVMTEEEVKSYIDDSLEEVENGYY